MHGKDSPGQFLFVFLFFMKPKVYATRDVWKNKHYGENMTRQEEEKVKLEKCERD